jgi:predicted N-acetyltransferase YhbS
MNTQPSIQLRYETPEDYRIVEELTREAFWNLYVPGCSEHFLLHRMRDVDAFIPELDLEASIDGKIVGNIVYSHAKLAADDGSEPEVITFGPVAVLPEYQCQGIGSALIIETLNRARELGYQAVLIYGNPDYYQRFGFFSAENFDIRTSDDMYATALLALELIPNALQDKPGRFLENAIFEMDEEEIRAFDGTFLPKPLEEGTPSQTAFLAMVTQRRPRA